LIGALADSCLEVFPAGGIESQLGSLPRGACVAVTCSERHGIDATLELTERLVRDGFRVVPHLSARQVADEAHLAAVLDRLRGLAVDSLFVPGGDISPPVGCYSSALELLRAMALMDHAITSIGIAAHAEGHPIIGTEELLEQLSAKQRYASYMVTQMCFDPVAIGDWLTDVRASGIHLPVRIGLPGVIERKRLVTTALRIGVGQSVGFLKKQPGLAGRLLAAPEYRPDDLLAGLAPLLADPAMGISGFHLYTLNQVSGSESWRASYVQRLQA
jgi:methylenetetrahydrofolate reductase (NADPH)